MKRWLWRLFVAAILIILATWLVTAFGRGSDSQGERPTTTVSTTQP